MGTPGFRELTWRLVAGEDLDGTAAAVRTLDAAGRLRRARGLAA